MGPGLPHQLEALNLRLDERACFVVEFGVSFKHFPLTLYLGRNKNVSGSMSYLAAPSLNYAQ